MVEPSITSRKHDQGMTVEAKREQLFHPHLQRPKVDQSSICPTLYQEYGDWDLALLRYNGGPDYPPLVRQQRRHDQRGNPSDGTPRAAGSFESWNAVI